MRATLLSLTVIGLISSSYLSQGDEKKPANDKDALQGAWSFADGVGPPDAYMVFKGDTFDFGSKSKGVMGKGTFKVNAAGKPKTIDMMVAEVGEGTKDFKGKTSLGIYHVEGDTLKWCANAPGKDGRPKDFVAMEGDSRYLNLVFKRDKK